MEETVKKRRTRKSRWMFAGQKQKWKREKTKPKR
uniref:Uncharacterized protein n=1 Tax=Rhizophora mucronata TaxID=61149 RepID=A0A2P2QD33_RHIMU